jgi:hypothetical protein
VGKRNGKYSKGNSTYPAVPRVPIIGYGDIKANTEGEGSSEDGGHINTCDATTE